jgi:hypothetical protein
MHLLKIRITSQHSAVQVPLEHQQAAASQLSMKLGSKEVLASQEDEKQMFNIPHL